MRGSFRRNGTRAVIFALILVIATVGAWQTVSAKDNQEQSLISTIYHSITSFFAGSDGISDPLFTGEVRAEVDKKQLVAEKEVPEEPGFQTNDLITSSTYVFSAGTDTLVDMSSDTTQIIVPGSDDDSSTLQNIGFEFWFDGVRYTQFGVNANGYLRLGAVATVSQSWVNALATTNDSPKIAPFWDDLCVGNNGKVHYKVVGDAPNRKLVIEFQNMKITRGTGCGGTGAGTFQVWLHESAGSVSPGAVQFVYGAGLTGSNDGGYSVGMQSGAASNYASVTTSSNTVSYSTANNSQANAIAEGTSYTFTPNIPSAAPSGLNFTDVTAVSQTLNWTDNATNETGYAIYRSIDGTNYSFVSQTAANATSYTDTGLQPSTNYSYRVHAVTEGVISSAISGSSTTAPPGNDTCNGAGGNWDDPATWADGSVPTATDNVTISSGCTVTVNVTNAVAMNLTIESGGVLQSPLTGTVTNNNLTVTGNVINNGTLDFSTNGDTSGAILTFGAGAENVSFSGNGPVTDVRAITVNKGSQSTVVELNTANFTVRGTDTDVAGYLTLTSGTFKISGTFTLTNRTFTTAFYTIPAAAGIWLNNPNYTVAATASGTTTVNNGLFRLTQGTYNVGLSGADGMGGGSGAVFIIEGGTFNVARFDPQNAVTYTQTGGTVNVSPTASNTRSAFGSFELFSSNSTFNMSGGTINIIFPANAATKVDWRVNSPLSNTNITGGTVVFGGGSAPANSVYNVAGLMPSTTVNETQTMRINNAAVFMRGSTVINNGTIDFTGVNARYDFGSQNSDMTYSGTGVFGTAETPVAGVGISANSTFHTTLNAPIFVNRVNLFAGGFINSNHITLGSGGTSTTVVQIGSTGLTTPGGSFDVSPVHNQGSGGQVLLYAFETAPRTTGFEINPTRIVTNINLIDNPNGVTLEGGDLTLTSTAAALVLTNGRFITGDNTVILSSPSATVSRTNGYVDGNLRKAYGAAGNKTFEVGTANGYSPVSVNVTAGTFPTQVTAKAVQSAHPSIPSPSKALERYWALTGTDITADLTFNYLDEDVPATANEDDFVIMKYDGAFTQPGGTVNTGSNTATITGVTSLSDWTLAETGALEAPGALQFDNATYSVDESGPVATITVTRTGGSDGAVSVDYATVAGGTANGGASCGAGVDYVTTSGTVSFVDGDDAPKTFNVPICDDPDVEGDETVNLELTNATGGATIGTPSTAVLTITDNDTASGPVTVTASAGTTSGTYNTLTEAVAAINDGTHQGDITVNINQSVSEPGSVVINSSGAGAASYTSVLIRPTADSVVVSGASAQGRGLIELNGADNVTIDGDNPNSAGTNRNLTLQNTATDTTTFTSVVRIALAASVVTTADNNAVKNVNILGSATGRNTGSANTTGGSENTSFGIFLGPGASTSSETTPPGAVTSITIGVGGAATANNLVISNNSITTAARAISINGMATTVAPGLQVTGNTIGNPTAGDPDQVYAIGITVQGSNDALISGNTVWVEGYVPASNAGHGINVGVNSANVNNATIENNKVNRVRNNNPASWSAMGINLGGGNDHVVRNNFVSGVINDQTAGTGAFGTTFGAYGIRVVAGTGHVIQHNSVHLYGTMGGTVSTNLTAAFVITATARTGMDVRNNIFSNQIVGGNPATPGTRNVAVSLPTGGTAAMDLTWNNNAYFVGDDALNRLAQVGTTFGSGEFEAGNFDPSQTTPATNFRSYTSTLSADGNNDNASFASTTPPPFTSNSDLHIPADTATRLESGGAAVGVATDIDLETRNATTPDIGADEFTGQPPTANDMAATGLLVPENGETIPTGVMFSPQARFTNNGTAAQTNVTVRYRILDASMTVVYNQTANISNINPLQNVIVTFPSTSIAAAGVYTIEASSELAGDTVPGNDLITGTFNTVAPAGGTITVGTGGDYTSLTNPGGLFEALNTVGISSDLTIEIVSDLTGETGVVPLNQLVESGAGGYTVTFKPSGAPRTISGMGATNTGLINLHGADRIVFDGSLSGGNDRSLTITNTQTGTSTVFWLRSASADNGATNNTIKNCIINGAGTSTAQTTAGILAGSGTTIGGPAEAPNNNNTITNNHIYGVQNSIYNQGNAGFDQNWTITNNDFGSTVEAEKNRFRGMLMGNANNFVISGNTVLGVTNFSGTTGANSGIQLAFGVSNGTVTGNRISNIHNLSASGTGAFGMQLSASPVTNVLIANNFIWDIQAAGSATVASNGHGITINGAVSAGGYKIYHNTINMNTNQASGTTAAVNVTNAVVASGAIDLRNNILANTQTTGNRYAVYSAAAAGVFSTINYNDYFAPNVGFIGGSARTTLADWQAATGQDANSMAVDPVFVSPTDLHLQSTSPVINMGVGGTGVTDDIDGDLRDAQPDIGADEFVKVGQPGTLQFSSATYTGNEADGTFTVTVTRTDGSSGTVTVDYATSNGTATGGASCAPGVDFINTSGTLTFMDGETSQTFEVTVCNDAIDEPDETFNYTLSNPTGGATIGTPGTAVQTIVDDDDPAENFAISIGDAKVVEGNAGTVNAVFEVTLTSIAPVNSVGDTIVSVQYSTSNGTATAGSDYVATSGTLNFSSTGTLTVSVPVNGDTVKESNEFFFVNLSNPSANATITDGQGVGIIVDEDRAYIADYDRDLMADFSVHRPSNSTFYVSKSSKGFPIFQHMGETGDISVPGDYDGDGKTDFALFRPSTGDWFVLQSSDSVTTVTNWGLGTDKPVQGDYDGDGKTDYAVYRPAEGTWHIMPSADSTPYSVQFGLASDRLVQADYDGDFKTDIAIYRDGVWYILKSSDGSVFIQSWGLDSDVPVVGDFDGDGRSDLTVYRDGVWYIYRSLTNDLAGPIWGLAGDIPVVADYDGDGTSDVAVYRPAEGNWYVLRSSNGSILTFNWGLAEDVPTPKAYLPQ